MPFSAVCSRYSRWSSMTVLKPPTSLIASVTPSNSSGWLSTSQLRAVIAARLFVGQEGQHDVARRLAALAQPLANDRQQHRVHVLHVDGPAAPDAAVARPRRRTDAPPVGRVGRDHVEVAMDQQRRREPGPRLRSWSTTLARFWRDSSTVGSRPTSASMAATYSAAVRSPAPIVAGVRGVDPDQVAGEACDLLLRGDGRHPAIVPPTAHVRYRLVRPRRGCLICYRDAAGLVEYATSTRVRVAE